MRVAGESTGYRVVDGEIVLETPYGEVRVKGEVIGVRNVSPGGARALASLALSLAIIASMLASARPNASWPFAFIIAYFGILTAAAMGVYISVGLLIPRRALVIRTGEGYVAYLIVAGKNVNSWRDHRLTP